MGNEDIVNFGKINLHLQHIEAFINETSGNKKNRLLKKCSFRVSSNRHDLDVSDSANIVQGIHRNYFGDRRFPLDNQVLIDMNEKENSKADHVTVHLGLYADEYARSLHALAVTVGSDIFFRSKAYSPETEEGRKTLAHELKHINQNQNEMFVSHSTKEDLEKEAVAAEQSAAYNPDPVIEVKIAGETLHLRKSKIRDLYIDCREEFNDWIENQERNMSEEEYLKFLVETKEKYDNEKFTWQRLKRYF